MARRHPRAKRPPATTPRPTGPAWWQRLDRLLPWILAGVALLVLGRAAGYEFVHWDDHMFLHGNPLMTPVTAESLQAFWRGAHFGLYMPLTYSVWALQAKVFGLHAGWMHATGLALHALNVVLVYQIVRRLLARRARARRGGQAGPDGQASVLAACGALVFAVHPLQVESVSWVSGMKDLLPAALSLLAIRSHFGEATRWRFEGRVPASTFWYLLALLAKPSVVLLGPVVVVLDVVLCGTALRTALRRVAAWLAIALPFAVVAVGAQPAALLEWVAPLWLRPFVAADALTFYLAKTVAPLGLAPEYGRTPEWLLASGAWRWSWVVPALVAAPCVVAAGRGRPAPLAMATALVLLLAPVLGLVPFVYQRFSTVADHYMYLPMAVVALSVGLGLSEVPDRRRPAAVIGALAACVVLAALSHAHQSVWRTDDELLPYAIAVNPSSALLRMNYGESLYVRGRYEESLAQFQAAAETRPHADAYRNVGLALVALGRHQEARAAFEAGLAISPGDAALARNLESLERTAPR